MTDDENLRSAIQAFELARDEVMRLRAENTRLREALEWLGEGLTHDEGVAFLRRFGNLLATPSETEERRNPQERAELSPYASMAREEAAAWADRVLALLKPEQLGAHDAVRQALLETNASPSTITTAEDVIAERERQEHAERATDDG